MTSRVNKSYFNKRVGTIKRVGLIFFFVYVDEKTWKCLFVFFSKCNTLIRDLSVPKYKVNLISVLFDLKNKRIKTCFYIKKQILGAVIKCDISTVNFFQTKLQYTYQWLKNIC